MQIYFSRIVRLKEVGFCDIRRENMASEGCFSSMYLFAVSAIYFTMETTMAKTCMKAIQSDTLNSDDMSNSDSKENRNGNSNDSNLLQYGAHPWQWVNFDCSSGCCGETGNHYCCSTTLPKSPGLVTAISVGIFVLILIFIVVLVCCMCHTSRQKRSQRMRRRRHTVAAMTPSVYSLPPSYEMCIEMSANATGGAYPAEVSAPPSYEEVMALTTPRVQHATSSTHVQAHAQERVHVRGGDDPEFSVISETNGTPVTVRS